MATSQFENLIQKQQKAFNGMLTSSAIAVLLIAGFGLGYVYLVENGWVTYYLIFLALEALDAVWNFVKWRKYDDQIRLNTFSL